MGYILTIINPSGDSRAWVESDQALLETLKSVDWSTTLRVIVERKL